jgi:hypothetical protein
LQDLAGLGGDLVDTVKPLVLSCMDLIDEDIPLDTDDKDQLGLFGNVEGAGLAALASKADLLTLRIAVLLDVGLGTLEDDTTLLLVGLLSILLA